VSVRVRWLLTAVVAVTVALHAVALGVAWRWYRGRGPDVGEDLTAMRQAVADTLVAAGDAAATTVGGLIRARTCSLGPLRPGGVYTLTAEAYVDGGQEDAFIGRVAERLPAHYRAQRDTALAGSNRPLDADGGSGVHLSVRQLGDGWITITATTGCTKGPGEPADPQLAGDDPAVNTMTELLAPLRTAPATVRRYTLACPDGRTMTTIAAVSRPTNADRLADRVPVPAGAGTFPVDTANRVAYRDGDTSVVIAASDDNTAITAQRTTNC
jgi:hypothetical protein